MIQAGKEGELDTGHYETDLSWSTTYFSNFRDSKTSPKIPSTLT